MGARKGGESATESSWGAQWAAMVGFWALTCSSSRRASPARRAQLVCPPPPKQPSRCECQQLLSVAARAHIYSPRPLTSPDRPQMQSPRAPAHYPAIPATDPADFPRLSITPAASAVHRCECQQPLPVAERAHIYSPRPLPSPDRPQVRFPRAPAHYPSIPATDPADFPCLSTTTLASAPRRCECQQPLSVAARAHMHSPRPTTSPEHRQMRFPRAPAHYPAIPATEPTDFAHLLAPAPQPCPPEKAPPTTNRGEMRQAACVCAAPTDSTNPPVTDSRPLTLQPAPQHAQTIASGAFK